MGGPHWGLRMHTGDGGVAVDQGHRHGGGNLGLVVDDSGEMTASLAAGLTPPTPDRGRCRRGLGDRRPYRPAGCAR